VPDRVALPVTMDGEGSGSDSSADSDRYPPLRVTRTARACTRTQLLNRSYAQALTLLWLTLSGRRKARRKAMWKRPCKAPLRPLPRWCVSLSPSKQPACAACCDRQPQLSQSRCSWPSRSTASARRAARAAAGVWRRGVLVLSCVLVLNGPLRPTQCRTPACCAPSVASFARRPRGQSCHSGQSFGHSAPPGSPWQGGAG